MKSIFYVLSVVLLLNACGNSEIQKFRAGRLNTGCYNSKSVLKNPGKLWAHKTSGPIKASPVVDKDHIYIGSGDSCFYALNKKSGKSDWKFRAAGAINSTALIDGNNIYFLSQDGNLYNLMKNSGKLVWKFKTEGEQKHIIKDYYNLKNYVVDFWDFFQSSPTIYSGKIYFGCGKFIYAVDKEEGTKVWSYKTEGAVHSSPAIKDNKLVIGSFDSRVYCLNALTGEKEWIYETGRDTAQYVWLGVQASPAISGDSVFIGSRDALIYCFNLNTGDTIWTNDNFNRSWMPSSFAVGDKLYSGSSDGFSFYAIDKNSGEIDYSINTHSYTFSSPTIDDKMAYIGSANGRLYGINLKRKKISWEFQTNGSLNDTLRIYNDNGEMNRERIKFLSDKLKVNNYQKLVDFYEMYFKSVGAILSSPIINEGTIYFGSYDGYVYAITN